MQPSVAATCADQGKLVVLLPGLDGTECFLRPLASELEFESRIVEYPAERGTDYARLLPLVEDALPKDREFVLLGWSFSGPLALRAAASNPPGLRGVVLASSFVSRPAHYVPAVARHLIRPAWFRAAGAFSWAKALFGGYSTPELKSLLEDVYARVGPEVFAERLRATFTVDARDALASCPVPVLYLAASRDRVVHRRHLREVQRLRPDTSVETIEVQRLRPDTSVETIEGPHLALVTAPQPAARALEAFVRAVRGSGSPSGSRSMVQAPSREAPRALG